MLPIERTTHVLNAFSAKAKKDNNDKQKQTYLRNNFCNGPFFVGCDPGHYGKAIIRNDSSYTSELKDQTHTKDTSIVIQPNSRSDVFHFGGLGYGRDYESCIYEFTTISLQPIDISKTMTKIITGRNNWTTTNPNTRRFSNKEINCEFLVTQSDIQ